MTARPRDKRLLNMLASVAVCAGLMIAYYFATGQEKIPQDTHVSFEHGPCQIGCRIYRVDLMADGTVFYQDRQAGDARSVSYHIPKSSVRSVLRAFKRARFFDTDVNAYGPGIEGPDCYLTLTAGHMKTSVLDACGLNRPEFAGPMQALDRATHYRAFIDQNESVIAALRAVPTKSAPRAASYLLSH